MKYCIDLLVLYKKRCPSIALRCSSLTVSSLIRFQPTLRRVLTPCRRVVMPVIVTHAVDPAHLVSTHKTRPTLATVATVAIPATLAREPEFFQSAWAALAPLLWDIGQDLIEHHGFQAGGEVRIARSPRPVSGTHLGASLGACSVELKGATTHTD